MISLILKQMFMRSGALIVVKAIGFFIRIPLFRILGAEGMGLYQMSYAAYGLVLTLFSGGVPTAVAILTANRSLTARFFHTLAIFSSILGILAGVLFYTFSPVIATLLGNSKLTLPLQCLAPAIVLVPLLSLIRGYLQGLDYVGIISTSEVIEQIIRSVVLLWLITTLASYSIEASVAGANIGAVAGAGFSLLFVVICLYRLSDVQMPRFRRRRPFPQPQTSHPVRLFFHTALAITCTRLIFPFSDFLDAIIIPHRLQDAGFFSSQAIALYGEMSGMAVTIAYLPTLFTAAISHVLTAKFSADWKSKKIFRFWTRINLAIQISIVWGISSSLIMYLYAPDFSWLMLGNGEISHAIRYLAIAPFVCGLREILTTIHWSTGNHKQPLWGLILAVILSVIAHYTLIPLPGFAAIGIAIGILMIDFIGLCWNSRPFIWLTTAKMLWEWTQKVWWSVIIVLANYFLITLVFPEVNETQYTIRLIKIFLAFLVVLLFLFFNLLRGRLSLIK